MKLLICDLTATITGGIMIQRYDEDGVVLY
jgi:hypothetical protein